MNFEILGLLLQVAWADEEVGPQEATTIISRAQQLDLPADYVATIEACLRGEKTLPPPDMGFLKKHREAALEAVRKLIATDNVVTEGESALLAEIEELL